MLNIKIRTIPHDQQRYPTVGDWFFNPDRRTIEIRVSDMQNWRFEFLVALHELVEVMLCQDKGISQQSVDDFDIAYEKKRQADDYSEPGDDLKAPYHRQHQVATMMEKFICAEMDIDWVGAYEKTIDSLDRTAESTSNRK